MFAGQTCAAEIPLPVAVATANATMIVRSIRALSRSISAASAHRPPDKTALKLASKVSELNRQAEKDSWES